MKTLEQVFKDWEAVIGLEVHTELTTLETKMFCNCLLRHNDPPNAHVCPVCLGMPGALPVPNKRAIEYIVQVGLALNCEIMHESMFYRKHYFYPDMAKNFQTTQGPIAFCMNGQLDLEMSGRAAQERPDYAGDVQKAADGSYTTPIRIQRIHMEEDAAKMIHYGGAEGRITDATESAIDYNRCGTPLIELVTYPDIRTPEEARSFMEQLRQIFLTLRISDCSLENGSMRCDGNVSVRRRGSAQFGTKTELKNLNSFKSLHDGLAFEICRQAEVLEQGDTVQQETRHFEPATKRTFVMRVKETADDYRLFPDPDLTPFSLSDEVIEHIRQQIPELPAQKRERYQKNYGISKAEATQIAADPITACYFEDCVAALLGSAPQKCIDQDIDYSATAVAHGVVERPDAKEISVAQKSIDKKQACELQTLAHIICNDIAAYLKAENVSLAMLRCKGCSPEALIELVQFVASDEIAAAQAREVFARMAAGEGSASQIIDKAGIRQVSDMSALEPIVAEVLEHCAEQVAQYKAGNTKVLGYLVGQCMKVSRGSGNPKLFNQLLAQKLEQNP